MNEPKEAGVAEQIRHVLAHHLSVDEQKIKSTALLREDLGLDSTDTIELVFKIEETFNLQVAQDDLEKFKTVSDLIDYVEAWLRRPASSTPRKEP